MNLYGSDGVFVIRPDTKTGGYPSEMDSIFVGAFPRHLF